MKPERILVPIDVHRCPLEVFDLVNGFAKRPEVTVIILHVVNVNIVVPENDIYEELAQEAEWCLQRLADRHIHPLASTIIHVRAGIPAEQILAEAAEQQVDLIILPNLASARPNRLVAFLSLRSRPGISRGMQRIIRESNCGVFVVNTAKFCDCHKTWGHPIKKIERAITGLPTWS